MFCKMDQQLYAILLCILIDHGWLNVSCSECDNMLENFANHCDKNWTQYIDYSLSSVQNSLNPSHGLRIARQEIRKRKIFCGYNRDAPFGRHRRLINHDAICSKIFIDERFLMEKKNVLLLIEVSVQFALNITIVKFIAEEAGIDCENFGVSILYRTSNNWCYTMPRRHCSIKVQWTVLLPSNEAAVYMTKKLIYFPFQFALLYQIIDDCTPLVYNHITGIPKQKWLPLAFNRWESTEVDLKSNWLLQGTPGLQFMLKTRICLGNITSAFQVCDGPKMLFCVDVSNNCSETTITITYFQTFCYFAHKAGPFNGHARISYRQHTVKATHLFSESPSSFKVIHTTPKILHKVWLIHADNDSADIYFNISAFHGYTEDNCKFGGYILRVSVNELLLKSKLNQTTQNYGPYCYIGPGIPLLNTRMNYLTLPNGTHQLVLYAYAKYYNINMLVTVRKQECIGVLNAAAHIAALQRNGIRFSKQYYHQGSIQQYYVPHGVALRIVVAIPSNQCIRYQSFINDGILCTMDFMDSSFHPQWHKLFSLKLVYNPTPRPLFINKANCTISGFNLGVVLSELETYSLHESPRQLDVTWKGISIANYRDCTEFYSDIYYYTISASVHHRAPCTNSVMFPNTTILVKTLICGLIVVPKIQPQSYYVKLTLRRLMIYTTKLSFQKKVDCSNRWPDINLLYALSVTNIVEANILYRYTMYMHHRLNFPSTLQSYQIDTLHAEIVLQTTMFSLSCDVSVYYERVFNMWPSQSVNFTREEVENQKVYDNQVRELLSFNNITSICNNYNLI